MKALIFTLTLLLAECAFSQSLIDDYLKLQNKDGSFGDKNKEIITSVAIMAFLHEGVTPSPNKYGVSLKAAFKFLNSRSEELLKSGVDEKFLYTLWALSDLYTLTGVSTVESVTEKMYQRLLKEIKGDKEWNFSSVGNGNMIFPFIMAMQSLQSSGIAENKQQEIMKAYALNLVSENSFQSNLKLFIEFIKVVWSLNDLPLPSPKAVKAEILASFMAGLNDESSKVRKAFLNKSFYLKSSEVVYLVQELEKSTVTELKQTAKDLRKRLGSLDGAFYKKIDVFSAPVSILYLSSFFSYTEGYEGFEQFGNEIKEAYPVTGELYDFKSGSKFPCSIESLSIAESKLFSAVLATMIFRENYHSLNSHFLAVYKAKVRQKKLAGNLSDEDPFDEEGLDLVD